MITLLLSIGALCVCFSGFFLAVVYVCSKIEQPGDEFRGKFYPTMMGRGK